MAYVDSIHPDLFRIAFVILSSFYALVTSTMDYSYAYPWAKKELLKETSYYTNRLRIRELRESVALSKKEQGLVKVVACREDEPICSDESSNADGPFCFSYATFFLKKSPSLFTPVYF